MKIYRTDEKQRFITQLGGTQSQQNLLAQLQSKNIRVSVLVGRFFEISEARQKLLLDALINLLSVILPSEQRGLKSGSFKETMHNEVKTIGLKETFEPYSDVMINALNLWDHATSLIPSLSSLLYAQTQKKIVSDQLIDHLLDGINPALVFGEDYAIQMQTWLLNL